MTSWRRNAFPGKVSAQFSVVDTIGLGAGAEEITSFYAKKRAVVSYRAYFKVLSMLSAFADPF